MDEVFVLLTFLLFGLVLLNGFSAGIVAFLYFWRKNRDVNRRALSAGLVSGMVIAGTLSGALLTEGFYEILPAVIGLVFVAIICGAASLPGAFILSRKIGQSAPVDPDIFS